MKKTFSVQIILQILLIFFLNIPSVCADSIIKNQDFTQTLTEQERAWLLSHPVLIMGIDRDFQPYEWIDSHGNYVGLTADYIALVGEYLGVKIEIVKDKSWAQILEMAKLGEIDIISDAVQTPEREKFLNFTKPFISTPVVIVDNGQHGYLDTIERLKGKKIAVEEGYFISELLAQDYPDINQLVVGNVHEALKAVLNGGADAYLGDAGLVSHSIRSSGMLSLRISGQTQYVSHHSIAATKQHPELVTILNKAIEAIPQSKKKEITYNWFSFKINNGIERETVLKYGLFMLSLILIVLYWNRRLFQETKKSKELEISLQEERNRFALAIEGAQDGLWDWDLQTDDVMLSERYETMLGYAPGELSQNIQTWHKLLHPDDKEQALKTVQEYLDKKGGGTYENHFRLRAKDGSWRSILGRGKAQFSADGTPMRFVGFNTDISHQLEFQEKLTYTAKHDSLTNLPNRFLLSELLTHTMHSVKRNNQYLALLFIDLDGFKEINDRYGHEAGDEVLSVIAQRMSQIIRGSDIVSRLGGDEFVIVATDLKNSNEITPMLQRLLSDLSSNILYNGNDMHVSASVGVSFYPQRDDIGNEALLRQADQAMYHAKLLGKNQYKIFDLEATQELKERQQQILSLQEAINKEQLVLYYQPKVDMKSNKVIGFEALLRWNHPQKGLLYPDSFLPLLEHEPSSMIELGQWVFENAFSQLESLHLDGLDITLSVNVSSYEVQQPNFSAYLKELFAKHPAIKPNTVEIELLETAAFDNFEVTSKTLYECQELGVSIAIDDFGTGYASLHYLKKLPMNTLKIDKSFVIDLLSSCDNLSIVEASIGLARAFGCHVVAEGVESEEHGKVLLQLGCDIAQGYAIAKAMPAKDIINWMESWNGFPSWGETTLINASNRAILHASVEHRNWIFSIEEFLQNKSSNLPELGSAHCHLGSWLLHDASKEQRNSPDFESLNRLHSELHLYATELLHSEKENKSDGIEKLKRMRDEILQKLESLMSAS
ncbi:MAG: EAL domain-containing protein [Sulfurimonas sp.]|nr:EAL domain-containing protein [Sulfurimonas sp.]